MALIDRHKKAFKRLMARCKTGDAIFVRDGVADVNLPIMRIGKNDLSNDGELKNLIRITFYKIEGDSDLAGVGTLNGGDVIKLSASGTQHKWTGEIVEETPVSITATFNYFEQPFTERR